MKARYEDASQELISVVDKLQNTFADRFIHISRKDLLLVFLNAPKSSWKIRTRLLNGLYQKLTGKKIVIEVHKQEFELQKPVERFTMLYRELYRIDLKETDKSNYKLVKPDVHDFKAILSKMGLNMETADQFFSKILPVEVK